MFANAKEGKDWRLVRELLNDSLAIAKAAFVKEPDAYEIKQRVLDKLAQEQAERDKTSG